MPASDFHIAHVLPWSTVGGTEHATLRIARSVNGMEFKHTAFCPGPGPVQEMFSDAGFTTVEYKGVEPSYRHPRDFISASFELAQKFRQHKVDLIHCADLLAAYYAAIAGKIARLPVLCQIRCSYPSISRRDQSFLMAVNKFVFVSQNAWQSFGYPVPARRGVVIYDGVDVTERESDRDDGPSVRREFDIAADTLIVGMVARVAPAKDYRTLARAAARVVSQFGAVRFLIVGDRSSVALNREHYEEVRQTLVEFGLAPYFIFTDHREDVRRLINAMDVFLLSTHTEGLPLVILEAMALGKPVLATRVGGVPELVHDGKTGLLHPHEDDELLANQLLCLLRDAEFRLRLATGGREFVRTQFTVSRFATGMTRLYREMLGDRSGLSEPSSSDRAITSSGRLTT